MFSPATSDQATASGLAEGLTGGDAAFVLLAQAVAWIHAHAQVPQ